MSTTSAAQALADLQDAITSLQGTVSALQTADSAIDAAILKLGTPGVSPADIEAAVALLNTASAAVKPVVADLAAQAANIAPPPPPGISVSVAPATATVAQGATQQFAAAVTGDPANAGVKWSLAPKDGLTGSIDQTGLYTPPTTAGGTDTVVATSVSDSTKSGSAVVTF